MVTFTVPIAFLLPVHPGVLLGDVRVPVMPAFVQEILFCSDGFRMALVCGVAVALLGFAAEPFQEGAASSSGVAHEALFRLEVDSWAPSQEGKPCFGLPEACERDCGRCRPALVRSLL